MILPSRKGKHSLLVEECRALVLEEQCTLHNKITANKIQDNQKPDGRWNQVGKMKETNQVGIWRMLSGGWDGRGVYVCLFLFTTFFYYDLLYPQGSGPIQWARSSCTLQHSAAARPLCRTFRLDYLEVFGQDTVC